MTHNAQFFDGYGRPLIGGRVYAFEPSTNFPKFTFRDTNQLVVNPQPILCDADGQCSIHLMPKEAYRFVVQNYRGEIVRDVERAGSLNEQITGSRGLSQ